MPSKVRIVTDSSAQFMDPSVIQRYRITVVPLAIQIGAQVYREGIDIDSDGFFRRVSDTKAMPALLPPEVEQFADTYARLARATDKALSIHISPSTHSTSQHSKTGTQTTLGRSETIT